jgi:flagellar M-ring protein FliF
MDFLNVIRQRIARVNAGFSSGQRTVVVIAVLALALGGYGFTKWAGKPSYAPLFSNLDPTDASAITEKLNSEGVPYTLADGGTTIMVPSDKVYQTRLDASAEGLPAGSADGYTLLDKQGVTTSEFRQRVDFQRAMEGELAKTIESIERVDSAAVHLVIPPEDVFADSDQKPSASVLVKTRATADLGADQVRAIDHLVASSVQGLDPNQITIADAKGNVLLAPGEEGSTSAAGDLRTRQTRAFEQARAKELQTMLDKVVGPGRSVVQVNADLDFDKRSTKTESYAKGTAPVLAEQSTSEKYSGTQSGATGVLGPDAPTTGATGSGNDYDKSDTRRDFGVDRTTEETESAAGKINKLQVAVLLDGKAQVNPTELQRAVAAAAGIDTKRGDVIEVTRVPFDDSAAKEAADELADARSADQREQIISLARTAGLALLVVVILFLAWRSMRKAAKAGAGSSTSIDLAELERQRAVLTRTDVEPANELPEPDPEAERRQLEIAAEDRKRVAVQQEVGELIQRQPEEVARLLRSWLADRRS